MLGFFQISFFKYRASTVIVGEGELPYTQRRLTIWDYFKILLGNKFPVAGHYIGIARWNWVALMSTTTDQAFFGFDQATMALRALSAATCISSADGFFGRKRPDSVMSAHTSGRCWRMPSSRDAASVNTGLRRPW